MASSSKVPWESISDKQKKEIAGIAAGWQAGRRTRSPKASVADEPMKDAANNESASPAHAGITMGEAHIHLPTRCQEEWEVAFRQVQANRRYNLRLLNKH